MNKLVIAIAALLCACGTKQNPRACCTDAADCMNVGLPVGTVCDEGLLCRGNRCVEDPCSSSAECDVSALGSGRRQSKHSAWLAGASNVVPE
jgi:hypothetical protein